MRIAATAESTGAAWIWMWSTPLLCPVATRSIRKEQYPGLRGSGSRRRNDRAPGHCSLRIDRVATGQSRGVDHILIQAALVLSAVAAILMSPFGRRTVGEVGRDGLMLRHARHLVHVTAIVALLVVVVALLNVR